MEISPLVLWAILGILLLIAEIISTTFVFAFFSMGAFVVALTTWLGFTDTLASQLFIFSVVSLVMLGLFRQRARGWFNRPLLHKEYVENVGEQATVTKPIPANGEGRIAYRGTEWTARASHGEAIGEGQKVVIQQMEGIKVVVKAA